MVLDFTSCPSSIFRVPSVAPLKHRRAAGSARRALAPLLNDSTTHFRPIMRPNVTCVSKPILPASNEMKLKRINANLTSLRTDKKEDNIQMAEELLMTSADEFTERWNFDPISYVPITPGRYAWSAVSTITPVQKADIKLTNTSTEASPSIDDVKKTSVSTTAESLEKSTTTLEVSKDVVSERIPSTTAEDDVTSQTSDYESNDDLDSSSSSNLDVSSSSSSSSSSESAVPSPKSLRQSRITEFCRSRKRVLSSCKLQEMDQPPRKKLAVR